jgi:hypothetical protein
MKLTETYSNRHPSVLAVLLYLEPNPNLPPDLLVFAEAFSRFAGGMVGMSADGPELTAGLRKLLEAKDCFIRANLDLDVSK